VERGLVLEQRRILRSVEGAYGSCEPLPGGHERSSLRLVLKQVPFHFCSSAQGALEQK